MAVSPQPIKRHEELYGDIGILNRCSICPTLIDSKRIIDASEKRARNVNPLRGFCCGGQTAVFKSLECWIDRPHHISQAEIVHFRYWAIHLILKTSNLIRESRFNLEESAKRRCARMGEVRLRPLLRDSSYTNKVSTPTKFAEYCAAGLIPSFQGFRFSKTVNERQVPFGSFHPEKTQSLGIIF